MDRFYQFTATDGSQFLIHRNRITDVSSHLAVRVSVISFLSAQEVCSFEVDMTIDAVFEYLETP